MVLRHKKQKEFLNPSMNIELWFRKGRFEFLCKEVGKSQVESQLEQKKTPNVLITTISENNRGALGERIVKID